MARTIRFDEMDDFVKDKFEQLVRAAVLETDNRCKLQSPVDTGRFRASWQVGQDNASGQGAPEGNYGRQYPIQRLNYQSETVGHIYSVHNNLPYAEPLANGSSKQATPGWVQGIAKDMQSWINSQADKISRES